ncbi:MAG TPA: hypothetical protein VLV50_02595 [Stellaceae bacterium]|nr:hypothetical protein [Stellaceae bacterium]
MAGYRIYWLNRDNRILARLEIDEPTDAAAIENARSILPSERDMACAGFEVWERSRLVHREKRVSPS